MRILHTADLHIGKTVNNFSMLEEQKKVLGEMVGLAKEYRAQAFLIAGDVYDRSIPTAEAVMVLNDFLKQLSELKIPVLMISGNHDSPERLGFAGDLLEASNVYIAGVYEDRLKQVTLQDEYGEVIFTLMPYVKPQLLGDKTSEEAAAHMLETIPEQKDKRQVLVTHYFVTNAGKTPEISDSETTVNVGGLDNVDCSNFSRFCYTALGHIHKAQRMDLEVDCNSHHVIYSGSPVAYSFSECNQEKSIVLADVDENGNVAVKRLPLHPIHKMRKIKGRLEELIKPEIVESADANDYLHVTLTNEEELIDPMGTLNTVYPNVMQIVLEKREKEIAGSFEWMKDARFKNPMELFEDFYTQIRGEEMDETYRGIIQDVVKEVT